MVQVAPDVRVWSEKGNEAADYLEAVVNQHAAAGWEFYRVDTIGVVIPSGCFGLFAPPTTKNYYVVTFRREAN